MGDAAHWVVIKSGSNQRFIFSSNKRRMNVGSSYLLTRLPVWVDEAIASVTARGGECRPVVNVSGVAQLLVDTPATGRSIVNAVTQKAIREAPGLEVWGWVSPDPSDTSDARVADDLVDAMRAHEQHRVMLPSPQMANPGIPFSARCSFTSEPIDADCTLLLPGSGGSGERVSPSAWARGSRAREGLRAMAELIGSPRDGSGALLAEQHLDQDISGTWVAVVHADGNGFGQLFMNLAAVARSRSDILLSALGLPSSAPAGDVYLGALTGLSEHLDRIAGESLAMAIDAVQQKEPSLTEWVLPLIVGGDDMTAVVHAGVARTFVAEYLEAFESATKADGLIGLIAQTVTGYDYLTACAGVAYVKPTHPFSDAYTQAEALCRSAKHTKALETPVSAFDLHVFHEAAGRELEQVRDDLTRPAPGGGTGRHWSGPVITSPDHSGAPGHITAPALEHAVSGTTHLSSSSRHKLRAGLLSGDAHMADLSVEEANARYRYGIDRTALRAKALAWLGEHVPTVPTGSTAYVPALTAFDVADVEENSR